MSAQSLQTGLNPSFCSTHMPPSDWLHSAHCSRKSGSRYASISSKIQIASLIFFMALCLTARNSSVLSIPWFLLKLETSSTSFGRGSCPKWPCANAKASFSVRRPVSVRASSNSCSRGWCSSSNTCSIVLSLLYRCEVVWNLSGVDCRVIVWWSTRCCRYAVSRRESQTLTQILRMHSIRIQWCFSLSGPNADLFWRY